ncbi:hypothetical protein L7F22_014895 [Adiantum nelumboides]|nr:hypothetical protein [Adiantum nelumboides]
MNSCDVVSPADFQEGGKQCFWERTEATLRELQEVGHRPSFKAWNTLTSVVAICGEYDNVQFIVAELIVEGEKPTEWSCMAMMQAVINAKKIKASSMWVTPDGDEKAPLDSYITLIEEYGKLKRAIELNVGDEAADVIDRYAKSGCLSKAQEVVDKLTVRSELTWTALIGGYAEHSCDKEELKLMGSMKDNNVSVSSIIRVCGLQGCGSIGALDSSQNLHIKLTKKGFETELLVASWNALLMGCSEYGLNEAVLKGLAQMECEGVFPDAMTIVCILKSLHCHRSVVDMYAKCGLLVETKEVFDDLLIQDVVSWSALISGSVSDVDKGQEIHMELVEEGFDSGYLVGSALASGYAKCGFTVEAHGVFDELDTLKVIFGTTLLASHPLHGHACSMTGAIGKRKVHEDRSQRQGRHPNNTDVQQQWSRDSNLGVKRITVERKLVTQQQGLSAQSQYQDKEFPANFEDQESSQELIHQARWKMTEMDWEGEIGRKAVRVKERRLDKAKKSSSGLFR